MKRDFHLQEVAAFILIFAGIYAIFIGNTLENQFLILLGLSVILVCGFFEIFWTIKKAK